MHIVSKVVIGIGILFTVGGIVLAFMGVDKLGELEEFEPEFSIVNATSGNITLIDYDGMGELGFTFYVAGEYVDADGDDQYDACVEAEITVFHDVKTNRGFSGNIVEANESENKYYSEVGDAYSECNVGKDNKESMTSHNGDALIKIGRACYGCMNGTSNISSNVPVWVTYDDQNLGEVIEDVIEGSLGLVGGFGGVCCGVIFLIIGGILAITMKDKEELSMAGMNMTSTGAVMVTQIPGQNIPTLGAEVPTTQQPVQDSGPTLIPDQE